MISSENDSAPVKGKVQIIALKTGSDSHHCHTKLNLWLVPSGISTFQLLLATLFATVLIVSQPLLLKV